MKEVVISGVTYQKASEVAKQFRYTTDYVGQLCRAGKIDAKLIGRSWFVNPDSLTAHKQQRYQKSLSTDDATPSKGAVSTAKNFLRKVTWNNVAYEPDEAELIPAVKKKPVELDIDPADATTVNVAAESAQATLSPTPLPTVSLNGTLKVASLDTYYDVNEVEEESGEYPQHTTQNRQQLQNPAGAISMRRQHRVSPAQPRDGAMLDKRDNYKNKGFLDKLSENEVVISQSVNVASSKERRARSEAEAVVSRSAAREQGVQLGGSKKSDSVSVEQTLISETAPAVEGVPVRVISYRSVYLALVLSLVVLFFLFSLSSHTVSSSSAVVTSVEFSFDGAAAWLLAMVSG